MVVLGNCDRTNAWLPTYPLGRRISSSRSSLIFFFICLNFCLGRPLKFLTQQVLSLFFFFSFFSFFSFFAQIALLSFQPTLFFCYSNFCLDRPLGFSTQRAPFFFFLIKPRKGNNIIYNHFRRGAFRLPLQTWCFFS